MISKTKIETRMKRKTSSELVETINLAKKHDLLDLAKKLSAPTRNHIRVNVGELSRQEEDKIIVAGKVLGQGIIEKKFSVVALGFSEEAKEKMEKAGCKFETIKNAIEKNKKIEGVLI
jgi:large subunit ribosomal protein L18e